MASPSLGLEDIVAALLPGPEVLAWGLAVALALDMIYPRHSGLALKLHPVRTSYIAALRLARPGSGFLWGIAVWIAVVTPHLAAVGLLLVVAYAIHPALHALVVGIVLKHSMSLRLLLDTCLDAAFRLESGDLEGARARVQEVVRRDTSRLGEGHLASACIETTVESLVDGYTSPLTYYAIAGPLAALLQRLANTLDGAIGFKTPGLYRVGWFSARMDTVLNLIPARLTVLALALASPLAGGSPRRAIAVWARWRGATESLNAGHPMAATAGALGVKLEKLGSYIINPGSKLPASTHIYKAVSLAYAAAALYTIAAVALLVARILWW
ncbi:MAG: cobalamin biosynthesis protein [Aeropyrum sp.]|nr:cobalamin biosynthesis protein [Aeropyrum sp.]